MVARSSIETKFRAVAQGMCETLWLNIISTNLWIIWARPMRLLCDNKSVTNIARNLIQHDRIKHLEIDWHFFKEKFKSCLICASYIPFNNQIANIFTKGLLINTFCYLTSKVGINDFNFPTWGGVENILCLLSIFIFLFHLKIE